MKSKMLLTVALAALVSLGLTDVAAAQFHGGFFSNSHGGFGIGLGFGHKPRRHVHSVRCHPVVHAGHWEVRAEKVWVEPTWHMVEVAAVYQNGFDACGRPVQVLIQPARLEKRSIPGYWKVVERRYWVDGYTTYHCGR